MMPPKQASVAAPKQTSKRKIAFRRFTKTDHEVNLRNLKHHVRERGKLDLDYLKKTDPELAGWCLYTHRHLGQMPWPKITRLREAGFFNAKEKAWLEMYRKLVIFKEVMGHTRVPARWKKNKRLSSWVHKHRSPQRKVPDYFRSMLDAIGFEWKLRDKAPTTPWEDRYEELIAYKKRFGHCEVPARWPENKRFGGWVSSQRLNKEILSDEQIEKLDALGFNWDIRGNLWIHNYEALVRFKEAHGHCRVPHKRSKHLKLGLWVSNTRRRRDQLSKAQIQKLDRLGFSWDPDGEVWEEHFKAFQMFVKIHEHPLVPAKRKFAKLSLGGWVVQQRQNYKNGKLRPDYKRRLDAYNFAWDVEAWTWEHRFGELVSFKNHFGHCRVPAKSWYPNPKLGNWLSIQRSKWDQLPEERRRRLIELGVERTVPSGLPENVRAYLADFR